MNTDQDQIPFLSLPRTSGILLHPVSFPSPYGIGDLGKEAYHFIDFLKAAGQHLWQVLPLTHTGFGDSPYQSFSAFAGQPLLISPDHLLSLDLLTKTDLENCPDGNSPFIDYGTVIPWKETILRLAYQNFARKQNHFLESEYAAFLTKNEYWLTDYSLFMACKSANGGKSWLCWEAPYRAPSRDEKQQLAYQWKEETDYYKFIQFLFFKEWTELKQYANQNDIKIIGDIPIFVAMDSADVWANQHLFQVDEKGWPTAVAGVPPDYFSAAGQLWGNPLYNWDAHKADEYGWWISRLKHQLEILDYLRIDHFRGFESYWAVPYGEDTAVNGEWMPGPGADLFLSILSALGDRPPIIAEDLGIITPAVEALRDQFGFPGMKVLQFAYDDTTESSYLPHQYTSTNCICYTGTHDNDTICGWYETADEAAKNKVRVYMNTDGSNIHWDFIRTCLGTIAAFAVFPLQDVLGLGKTARMNTPGEPAGNWAWHYKKEMLSKETAEYLKTLSCVYGRY